MDYTVDFEFDGYKGKLISMSLVREDLVSMYVGFKDSAPQAADPWVLKNVVPVLNSGPFPIRWRTNVEVQQDLERFFAGDSKPNVISDWPDDIAYFCQLLLTGPGTMINIPGITFEVKRIDAYPTRLKDAVQHNALWDAQALMYKHVHPNPPTQLMIVRVLNGKRYYYAEHNELQKKGQSLGNWTRKRHSCDVVHYDTFEEADKVVQYIKRSVDMGVEGESAYRHYGISYHNRSHVYYGRCYDAINTIAWLFDNKKCGMLLSSKKGNLELKVVAVDTNSLISKEVIAFDLTSQRPLTKKRRDNQALHIDQMTAKFNPLDGSPFGHMGWSVQYLRTYHPAMEWEYNPWTGNKRTPEQILLDPYGTQIAYGDNK